MGFNALAERPLAHSTTSLMRRADSSSTTGWRPVLRYSKLVVGGGSSWKRKRSIEEKTCLWLRKCVCARVCVCSFVGVTRAVKAARKEAACGRRAWPWGGCCGPWRSTRAAAAVGRGQPVRRRRRPRRTASAAGRAARRRRRCAAGSDWPTSALCGSRAATVPASPPVCPIRYQSENDNDLIDPFDVNEWLFHELQLASSTSTVDWEQCEQDGKRIHEMGGTRGKRERGNERRGRQLGPLLPCRLPWGWREK